jgi:mono/diheme cytochrome c family protein
VTEIPEHLLKRSKERRAAIGGEGASSDEPAAASSSAAVEPAAAAPAPAAPAAAPPPVAAPPQPVRPEVAAALRRRKVPIWALPVLVALPLWAYVYQATLEPPPKGDDSPLALGQAEYASCAACHSADGSGGVGPELKTVTETWPDFRDHLVWVRLGSTGWPATQYGANDKHKNGGMPPHPDLTDQQLAQVVLYERVTFGGEDPTSEDALKLTEVAEGTSTLEQAGLGPVATRDGVDPSALKPGG